MQADIVYPLFWRLIAWIKRSLIYETRSQVGLLFICIINAAVSCSVPDQIGVDPLFTVDVCLDPGPLISRVENVIIWVRDPHGDVPPFTVQIIIWTERQFLVDFISAVNVVCHFLTPYWPHYDADKEKPHPSLLGSSYGGPYALFVDDLVENIGNLDDDDGARHK